MIVPVSTVDFVMAFVGESEVIMLENTVDFNNGRQNGQSGQSGQCRQNGQSGQSGQCCLYAEYVTQIHDNMKISHYHDFYEIFYFTGRQMTYFLDSKPLKLNKHDIVLVDRYLYHRTLYLPGQGHERFNISFGSDDLKHLNDDGLAGEIAMLFKKTRLLLNDLGLANKINGLFFSLCEAFSQPGHIGRVKSRLILCELLLRLLELSEHFDRQDSGEDLNKIEKRISKIAEYINANFHESITLDTISKNFYISKHYLCHAFKKISGLSVTDFINKRRLSEAEMLLKYSSLNISQICEKTGFNSHGYFIELFKRQYGLTPLSYRKLREK